MTVNDDWVATARHRWPEARLSGSGAYAVLSCPATHSQTPVWVALFQRFSDAFDLAAKMNRFGCRAGRRHCQQRDHEITLIREASP